VALLCALLFIREQRFARDLAGSLAAAGVQSSIVRVESLCLDRLRYRDWDICFVDESRTARALRKRLHEEAIDVPVSVAPQATDYRQLADAVKRLTFGAIDEERRRPRGRQVTCADLTIDPANFDGYVGPRPLNLTRREFHVLYVLALEGGGPLNASQIALRVGLSEEAKVRKAVTIQIVRLRKKMQVAASEARITNRRGAGWSLE
jgi:DNA-binding response OmpR family regulator